MFLCCVVLCVCVGGGGVGGGEWRVGVCVINKINLTYFDDRVLVYLCGVCA